MATQSGASQAPSPDETYDIRVPPAEAFEDDTIRVTSSEKRPDASSANTADNTSRPSRRKRKDNVEEHGNSWAKGKQWEFLESRFHLYYDACNNKAWDGFYESSVDAWVEQGFKLESIGKTPLPNATPGDVYNRQLRKRAKNVSHL